MDKGKVSYTATKFALQCPEELGQGLRLLPQVQIGKLLWHFFGLINLTQCKEVVVRKLLLCGFF